MCVHFPWLTTRSHSKTFQPTASKLGNLIDDIEVPRAKLSLPPSTPCNTSSAPTRVLLLPTESAILHSLSRNHRRPETLSNGWVTSTNSRGHAPTHLSTLITPRHIGEPRQRTFSTDLLNPPGRQQSALPVPLGLLSSSAAIWTQTHRQQDFTFGPCEGLSEDKLGHRQGCDYWPFWGV